MPTLKSVSGVRDYLFDPVSGIIYVRFWVQGERFTRSTRVKGEIPPSSHDMKMAVSSGRKIIADFDKEVATRSSANKGLLFVDWVPVWLDSLSVVWKSKAARLDAKSRWDNHLGKFLYQKDGAPFDIRRFNEGVWLEYAVWFQKRHPGKLLKHHRVYLRHFLNFMNNQRDPITNERLLPVVPKLKDFDPGRDTPGTFVPPELEEKLLAAATKPRHRLQIEMRHKMGMRPGEVTQCKKEWIKWDIGEIQIPASYHKTGRRTLKARTYKIHPEVRNLLREVGSLKFKVGDRLVESPFLFPARQDPTKPMSRAGDNKAWSAIKARAGVTGRIRRHDGRVSRATKNALLGIPLKVTQEALGMTEIVLNKAYTKIGNKALEGLYDNDKNLSLGSQKIASKRAKAADQRKVRQRGTSR